ncbi:MAG TPA: hypothetical protein VE078_15780, partial [Thermoanaerobaculia bacterium]|nr:hypothetical protein [Thermoanaerobaculia bacterium]
MNQVSRAFAAAAFLLSTAIPSSAQQAPVVSEPFGEVIDVRVVNVEVVVTDRDGKRVEGLQAADFHLKVDGKEVPVDFFTEIRERQTVAAQEQGTAAKTATASLSPGEPVGTNYLVFVDDYFSTPPRRNEALMALKNDLSRLGPKDRMAVVSFDGARLKRLAG